MSHQRASNDDRVPAAAQNWAPPILAALAASAENSVHLAQPMTPSYRDLTLGSLSCSVAAAVVLAAAGEDSTEQAAVACVPVPAIP